jgi:hypothetical protein
MFLSGLPPQSKTRRSLEWACAKDRADRQQRTNIKKRRSEEFDDDEDIPELDLDDALGSTDEEDLITPDTSLQAVSVPTELLSTRIRQAGKANTPNKRVPRADEEAARALLAFRGDA